MTDTPLNIQDYFTKDTEKSVINRFLDWLFPIDTVSLLDTNNNIIANVTGVKAFRQEINKFQGKVPIVQFLNYALSKIPVNDKINNIIWMTFDPSNYNLAELLKLNNLERLNVFLNSLSTRKLGIYDVELVGLLMDGRSIQMVNGEYRHL